MKRRAQDATPRRKERSSRDVAVGQRIVIQRPPLAVTSRSWPQMRGIGGTAWRSLQASCKPPTTHRQPTAAIVDA